MTENWVYGVHAVSSVLEHRPEGVIRLYLQKGRHDDRIRRIESLAKDSGVPVEMMARHDIEKKVTGNHQGVLAAVKEVNELDEGGLESLIHGLARKKIPPFFLVLDTVTDPHNLGACLRTANAVGVHAVIYPKDKSARLNATVRKVACGAADFTPVVAVTNLARTLKWLKECGVWVTGAAGEAAQPMYEADLTGPLAIVMGNEGSGLRRLTRENCDQLVKIPMSGQIESLNVSVATGVLLYEASRQRRS